MSVIQLSLSEIDRGFIVPVAPSPDDWPIEDLPIARELIELIGWNGIQEYRSRWHVKFKTMFSMSEDSHLFIPNRCVVSNGIDPNNGYRHTGSIRTDCAGAGNYYDGCIACGYERLELPTVEDTEEDESYD